MDGQRDARDAPQFCAASFRLHGVEAPPFTAGRRREMIR